MTVSVVPYPLGCPGDYPGQGAIGLARQLGQPVICTGAPRSGYISERRGGQEIWGIDVRPGDPITPEMLTRIAEALGVTEAHAVKLLESK